MIPTSSDVVEVKSNITSDQMGQFTVDENSLGKIMSVLTNLYSDPEMAVVREYATNALDSQIEASETVKGYQWRPIEVTLPNRFNKEYRIRDFGIGMSTDDIKDIYSKYGKSTKESSNSVTGMLGLGSKCALTYTSQFTITGYKAGIRTQAMVTKNDEDIPVFIILDTSKTTEPNGVEITVPVRDNNTFAEKSAKFFKFWDGANVLIDGAEPAAHGLKEVRSIDHDYLSGGRPFSGKIRVYLQEQNRDRWGNYEQTGSYIVMGNVPYTVDPNHIDQNLRNAALGFVVYVPMGSVTFPPNREVLTYNKRTMEVITKIFAKLFEDMLQVKLDEITNAPDHITAWKLHSNLAGYFKNHKNAQNLTYKGESFPERLNLKHSMVSCDWQGHGKVEQRQHIMVQYLCNTVKAVVTGVPAGTKPTSYFKKKLAQWMSDEGFKFGVDYALLVDADLAPNVWTDHLVRITADEIKAIKLPSSGVVGPRPEAPWEYYTCDNAGAAIGRNNEVDITVPKGYDVAYCSPQDIKDTYRKSGANMDTLIKYMGGKVLIVVTSKNRYDRFKRLYPTARPLSAVVQDRINNLVATAIDAEYIIGKLEFGELEFLKKVKADGLKDTELKDLAVMVQTPTKSDNYSKAEVLHNYAKRALVSSTLPNKKDIENKVSKKYPLINYVGKRNLDHLVIYCNAVYADGI